MSRVALVSALLVLSVAACSGLECYQCTGCDEGERGNPIQCSSNQNSCLKVVLGTRVEKSCTQSAACTLGDVEKTLSGVFNDISSAFGSDANNRNEAKVIHCCSSDYCNDGAVVGPATVGLLLLPVVLSALLR